MVHDRPRLKNFSKVDINSPLRTKRVDDGVNAAAIAATRQEISKMRRAMVTSYVLRSVDVDGGGGGSAYVGLVDRALLK